jgi:hypothetical protein
MGGMLRGADDGVWCRRGCAGGEGEGEVAQRVLSTGVFRLIISYVDHRCLSSPSLFLYTAVIVAMLGWLSSHVARGVGGGGD